MTERLTLREVGRRIGHDASGLGRLARKGQIPRAETEQAVREMRHLYELAEEQGGRWKHNETHAEHAARLRRFEEAKERNGYHEAWKRMATLEESIGDAARELMGYPMTTTTAIAWKARLAILMDCWQEEALDDVAALVGRARECA